jgi:D-alanyl-D-alanine carboxypeptidase
MPADDLLTIVTLEYGLSREYEPADLVPLGNYLPVRVTLGYPTEVRAVIVAPLLAMIAAMESEGLRPTLISGYRSYPAQAIAYAKWLEKTPEWVSVLSAPPGFSEHQLGTTVDFGSPELPALVGDPEAEFHTNFYKTSEGLWLEEHAHEYGFTLSYPRGALELTGFTYEPWHYRYVGRELATQLKQEGTFLSQHLLSSQPPPCAVE